MRCRAYSRFPYTRTGGHLGRARRKGGKIQALALPAPAASRINAYLVGRDDVTALPAVPASTAAAWRWVLFATGTGPRMGPVRAGRVKARPRRGW